VVALLEDLWHIIQEASVAYALITEMKVTSVYACDSVSVKVLL